MREPEDYAIGRLREALARDDRVAEMSVEVRIAAGKVFLTGQVPTEERRQAVGVIAGEVLPEYEVHNETVVTEIGDTPRVAHSMTGPGGRSDKHSSGRFRKEANQ